MFFAVKGGKMQVNPRGQLIQAFETELTPFITKSKKEGLNSQDIKNLDVIVERFKSDLSQSLYAGEGAETASLLPISESEMGEKLLGKVEKIKEKNLNIQRNKLIEGARRGELDFADFKNNVLSFSEKMSVFLAEAPCDANEVRELIIRRVPAANGELIGELKLKITETAILDDDGMVLSQINDPVYREALLTHGNQKHYNFEFFDAGRSLEIAQTLNDLSNKKESIEAVRGHLMSYFEDFDEDAFNQNFTAEQRRFFEVPPDDHLTEGEIMSVWRKYEEMAALFPIEEESVKSNLAKATIHGRFCEDGSIGELKSVNIHSRELGGAQLMNFWDGFCNYMEADQVYLEDDAKIEGSTGSYNLRLFRLMALTDKASWYADSYGYRPYHKDEERGIENIPDFKRLAQRNIEPFREMTLHRAAELLQQEEIRVDPDALLLLEKYTNHPSLGPTKTLGDLVKHIGNSVRQGEALHKEIDLIFSMIHTFSKYEGSDGELLDLKEKAQFVVNDRFYRKSFTEK